MLSAVSIASKAMLQWIMAYHFGLVHAEGLEQLGLSEHTAIVDAIEAGDAAAAERAMADHLNRANKLYRLENR